MHPIKHFVVITKHRHKVISHCRKSGIFLQGLRHDLSKYSPTEFIAGAKNFAGDKSPNVNERNTNGFSRAWLHHQGRNKHHYEYWVDYDEKANKKVPVPMPTKYLIEMFCDRVAASKIYYGDSYTDDTPLAYFEKTRSRRYIHEKTSDQLEKLLRMLSEEGEEKTFHYIKYTLRADSKKNKSTWK